MCHLCWDPPDRMAVLFVLPASPELTQLRKLLQATGRDVYVTPTFEEAETIFNENMDRMELMVIGDHLDDAVPAAFIHVLVHRAYDKLRHNMAVVVVSENPEIREEMVMCCCGTGIAPSGLRSELSHLLRINMPDVEARS